MVYSVSEFKAILDGLGYNLGPNGYGGNNGNNLDFYTQAAIQEFQAHQNIPETGLLDRLTAERARLLMRNLQQGLKLTVDTKLSVNELYGPRTLQAVMQFQKLHNLPITGIAGTTVRKKLEAEIRKQFRKNSYKDIKLNNFFQLI
jgi:peptidoglycan hydrolase-like protein with peptidoglycan-binding domain